LVSLLRDHGYETFELPSPIGATRLIVRERIQIIVLDVMMPSMNGDKLAKMLRSNSRFDTLGIILMSSCGHEELSALAKAVKADAVVSKDELQTALLPAVARLSRETVGLARTEGV
jgi:CheY-like chemotaxis protein